MIDTSTWTKFKVSDIFVTKKHGSSLQVPTGAMMSKKDLEDGDTPRVTVSNYNNGITGYYADSDNKNYRTYENFISVSFLGTVFYQPKKVSLDMKVHCLKPLDYELNVYSAGYIVSIIRKAISNFAYSDQLSSTVLAELEFALPATSDGQPDWDYMESYMKAVMEESEKSLENLKKADDTKHLIDVSGWGEFQITDLFDMSLPKGDLQVKKVEDGDIPLITPSNFNNGMLQRISEKSPSTLYDKGSLTVDMFGNAYFQEEDFFVTAHGHVNVLLPKTDLNVYTGTFLASTIRAMFFDKYGFNEMCTLKVLKAESIKLPITSTGEPDWQYMEDYMKQIMDKSEQIISDLQIGA